MNKLREKLARFMYGRYGADELGSFLMVLWLFCAVIGGFGRGSHFGTVLWSWELVLFILVEYRMLSKNIQKRYAENQKYLAVKNKVRRFFGKTKYMQQQRREFHIYTCPQCRQKIRIPRGKGKISIRCPKCGMEFVKNS